MSDGRLGSFLGELGLLYGLLGQLGGVRGLLCVVGGLLNRLVGLICVNLAFTCVLSLHNCVLPKVSLITCSWLHRLINCLIALFFKLFLDGLMSSMEKDSHHNKRASDKHVTDVICANIKENDLVEMILRKTRFSLGRTLKFFLKLDPT